MSAFKISWNRGTAAKDCIECNYINFPTFIQAVKDVHETIPANTTKENFKNWYFLRGYVETDHRNNENLKTADLLVLDIDSNTPDTVSPPPQWTHDKLKENNLNHFIYTSSSHTEEIPKYRVVIPCYIKHDNARVANHFLLTTIINSTPEELGLDNASNTWSQPWFMSTSPSQYFSYTEGSDLVIPHDYSSTFKGTSPGSRGTAALLGSGTQWKTKLEEIANGQSQNPNILSLTTGMANDGVNPATITQLLEFAFEQRPEELRDKRWQDGVDMIPKAVESAVKKAGKPDAVTSVEDEDLSGDYVPALERFDHLPYPPGKFGSLCKSANKMFHHPNQSIAVVTGVGLLAGIMGRKFNVSHSGLNLYISLLADTGVGKDGISSVISSVLHHTNPNSSKAAIGAEKTKSFHGPQRFTGPKSLSNSLSDTKGYSKVCVFTEAGIMMGSTAGDSAGLSKALLSFYTKSGVHGVTGEEAYSDIDKGIDPINSPALTIVSESTPEVFVKAMISNDAADKGELPRQWLIKIKGKKEKINRNRASYLDSSTLSRLNYLITFCLSAQFMKTLKESDIVDIKLDDGIWDYNDELTELEYKLKVAGSRLESIVCSRAWVKTVKLASIATAYNRFDKDSPQLTLSSGSDEWAWAKAVTKREMAEIEESFTAGASDDMEFIIKDTVIPILYKMFHNGYAKGKSGSKKMPNIKQKRTNQFTFSQFHQASLSIAVVKGLTDDSKGSSNPMTGSEKIIRYMVNTGYLYEEIDGKWNKNGTKRTLQMTTHLVDLIKILQKTR